MIMSGGLDRLEKAGRPIGAASGPIAAGTPRRLRGVEDALVSARPLHRAVERDEIAEMVEGWRGRLPKDGRAMAASVLVHAAIFASLMVSFNVKMPDKPETRTMDVFTVSMRPGDGVDVAIPKTSAPRPVKETKPDPKPVEDEKPAVDPKPAPDPKPETPPTSSSPASSESTVSANPGGGMIWTPPQPRPNASGIREGDARQEQRVEMPRVDLPQGASDPVLLSYDQGRYSDAAAMSEASRLSNNGTITMAVTVDAKGAVSDCVVTSTSGSRMLDERACLLVRSYAYRPAQDNDGRTHGALVTEVLEWARDGKFSAPADAKLEEIRKAEGSMPRTGRQAAPASVVPKVSMPGG